MRPSLSTADRAAFMQDIMKSARGFAQICGQDFGPPASGAAPLD
jgi:hypothetical protein